jgi:hypothetical protein
VIGIDLAAGAVAHGRERASAEGLGNLELRLADAYRIQAGRIAYENI